MLASMFLVLKGTRSLNGAQCVSVGNFKVLSLVLTDKKESYTKEQNVVIVVVASYASSATIVLVS